MEWLSKLLGGVTQAKPDGGSVPGGIMGALGEAIPPKLREMASSLIGEQPVRDLLQRGTLPTQQVIDGAQQARDAVPKEAGGFVEQGMALLKDRFKL
jgi:hypothetical protein